MNLPSLPSFAADLTPLLLGVPHDGALTARLLLDAEDARYRKCLRDHGWGATPALPRIRHLSLVDRTPMTGGAR